MSNTSVLTKIPENTSFLQPTRFSFLFPELPFLRYFCQSVSIPGVSTNAVSVETPFSNTFRHGDKLNYDGLNITAIIDEDINDINLQKYIGFVMSSALQKAIGVSPFMIVSALSQ